MSAAVTSEPCAGPAVQASDEFVERRAITRAVAGIGAYAALFGVTFGAVATASGLSVPQAMVLSTVGFTGASQFALVGIVAAGGTALAAVSAALLLGLRNAFYGLPVSRVLRPRGLRRLWTAHFVIDETTAMTVAQPSARTGRFAFWATGLTLFVLWIVGTLIGALIGTGIDTSALGLDAAAPAIFLALLWPQLARERSRVVAVTAVIAALSLVTVAPPGVPILAAASIAIVAGLIPARQQHGREGR